MKLDHHLIPYTKINSKWIKDLDVRPESIKVLEKKKTKKQVVYSFKLVLVISFWICLLRQEKQTNKQKINKWNYIKLKASFTAKETINKTKRQPTKWEEIFANHVSDKELISKKHKELLQLNIKKPNNPILRWPKRSSRHGAVVNKSD